jgi:hypothetical protein
MPSESDLLILHKSSATMSLSLEIAHFSF